MDLMSQRIYNRRKELKLTMEELADKVGVTKSTISKWEKGHVDNIKSSNIASLSEALGVTPVWLMGMDAPILSTSNGFSVSSNDETPNETNDRFFISTDYSDKKIKKASNKPQDSVVYSKKITSDTKESNSSILNDRYLEVKKTIPYLSNPELDALENYIALVRSERAIENHIMEIEAEKDMHDADLFWGGYNRYDYSDYNDYDN